MKNKAKNAILNTKSFTLVELLIVVGLIAVLSVAIILAINPAELIKQARDSQRLSDLTNLSKAISLYEADTGGQGFMGTSSVVYVSIPDTTSTCANLGLPQLPPSWSYRCVSSSTLQNIDGTGWIPINFNNLSFGKTLSKLPIDPINTTSSGNYYTYVSGGSFELTSILESSKYKMLYSARDGGRYFDLFEKGTDLKLNPVNYSPDLLVYYDFDSYIPGYYVRDISGHYQYGSPLGYIRMGWKSSVNPDGPLSNDAILGKSRSDGGYEYPNDEAVTMVTLYSDSNNPPQQSEFSILVWVKINSNQPSLGRGYIVARCWGGSEPYWCGYNLYYDYSNKKVVFFISKNGSDSRTTSNGGLITSSSTVEFDVWTFLAATYDGKKMRLYINGNLDSELSYTDGIFQKQPGVSIGSNTNNNSTGLKALYDEVRIYNRSLSGEEIKEIYNLEKP